MGVLVGVAVWVGVGVLVGVGLGVAVGGTGVLVGRDGLGVADATAMGEEGCALVSAQALSASRMIGVSMRKAQRCMENASL